MKNKFLSSLAVFALAVASVFTVSAIAQTTDEGAGPTEQPSAPMEVGTPQQEAQPPQGSDAQPQQGSDASQSAPMEAQPGGPAGEAPAKTDLGVARISMIHGDVSTQRGDSGDWSAATLNQPVMGGDKISTGDGARTELQLDFANIFRLGANSKANLATFTQKDIQIQLSQGIANYTVSKDSEAEPEIDTPNVSLHPAHHDGVFRIEVQPNGDTLIIVRKGEAQIATPQGSADVRQGEMATVRGDSNSAEYKISSAPDPDDWDRWNADRDHMIRNSQAWKHTNRYYTGSEDLDSNGRWQNVPDYGDVWVPNEPDGWAPYRDGNWTYEPYYGWTWVGYEPWGWAPYHYGRWFPYGGGWAWWPGPVYGWYRPFWAPAYVSFWGVGWGVGFGWGGFGWLPIGPCDFFHPWWGGFRGRFGVVNVTNIHVTNINRFGGISPLHGGNRFSNIAHINDSRVSRGFSTVGAGHFGTGRVSATAATHEQLSSARMMAGNLPVIPTRASLSASGRAAAASTVRSGGSEHFFGAVHNNATRPESFDRQTAGLRQTMAANHVTGIAAGGRGSFGASPTARGTVSAGTTKPSAGTFSGGRENTFSRGASTPSTGNPAGNRGVERPFTPPTSGTRASGSANTPERGASGSSAGSGGFRPFTPPSRSEVSRGEPSAVSGGGRSGSYWSRTSPNIPDSIRSNPNYGGGRPQLDMRQPIVPNGRESRPSYGNGYPGRGNYPGYGGYPGRGTSPNYGGHSAPPSYGGSHGGYSGGGHVSAPSGGGHPSGGGGGGHSSGGGGHSSGGGGHH